MGNRGMISQPRRRSLSFIDGTRHTYVVSLADTQPASNGKIFLWLAGGQGEHSIAGIKEVGSSRVEQGSACWLPSSVV